MRALRRWLCVIQGGSYLGFGGWAFLRREHYVRVHELGDDAWVLNAHAGWMAVVGTALLQASLRDKVDATVRLLGIGAATSLAINNAAMLNEVASIYRKDLASNPSSRPCGCSPDRD